MAPAADGTPLAFDAASYDMAEQLFIQIKAVLLTLVWSGVISAILFFAIDKTIGLRANPEMETEGLDLGEHGERAYN